MPRTGYVSSVPSIYSSLKVKPTDVENKFLISSKRTSKSLKYLYSVLLHDNIYSIVENLVLDWLVVQLCLQFFAISHFSNGFVEILVNDVLSLGSVNIRVIYFREK